MDGVPDREAIMSGAARQPPSHEAATDALSDVASKLVRLMPRDLVFTMRFLGESQHQLQQHFRDFMAREMEAAGMTQDTHPMIHAFIERHAILMRDFVFSGVALSHQFRIDQIERLIGDDTSLMRVDIWDQLKSHIETAERQFQSQLPDFPRLLAAMEAPGYGRAEDA